MTEILQMPSSIQHEKAVLSVLLNYPDRIDEAPHLCEDHFHHCRQWFKIIREVLNSHQSGSINNPDLILTARKLGIEIANIGGYESLTDLWTYQPSPLSFTSHVPALSEFRARRMAVLAARAVEDAAMTGQAEDLSAAITAPMLAISEAMTDSTPPKTLKAIIGESLDRFKQRATGAETAMGIPTISAIDQHLRGAHPGRLWVIGAYPEGGKSVMAGQMILDAALAAHPCLFLSLEMSERDLMDRMIVQAARIDARAFTEPKEYARENGGETIAAGLMQSIQRVVPELGKAPMRLQRPSNRQLPTIIAAIRKAHREMGIKIAAIDYVQVIKSKSDSREGEISEVSHALQEVAQDLGITIIALSQLNLDGDTKHGKVIEEDADAVISIIQDRNKESETYKQHRHVLIAKDRHYGSGGQRIPLVLDREKIRFVYGEDQTAKTKPKFQRG